MRNTVIYLIGFPGTGKYTIAKEIAALENFIVVDNHYINNPVFALIEQDGKTKLSPRVFENASKIREAVLDTMAHISPQDHNFVLTNMLLHDDPGDHKIYNEVQSMAETRGSSFIPVRLFCDLEELQRRVVSKDRKDRLKETCPKNAQNYFQNEKILEPQHKNLLEMDVTSTSPKEAAKQIIKFAETK